MLRRFLFIPILLAAAALAALLTALGPKPEAQEIQTVLPEVRVVPVRVGPHRVTVSADGAVRPVRRTTVAAGIAGQVVWAAADLRDGVRVEAGAPLFRIETLAYELAVTQARSQREQARLLLRTEEGLARLAAEEWSGEGAEPDPLALRVPQLAAAQAALAAAEAAVRRAEHDLERTEIRAPHGGLVGTRHAEVGEWAAPGSPLLELLAVDVVETRVSLPDAALELVDLPFGGVASGRGPRARLTAVLGPALARDVWTWEGRLVRMEGEVDPATRFLPAVIEVRNPYGPGPEGRPPLVSGMFVRAEIEGREFPEIAVVPRSAFREDGRVLVVDNGDRIRIREVDAFWSSGEADLLVRQGLRDGEQVVTNPPRIVTDGMEVRVTLVETPAAPAEGSPGAGR